MNEADQQCFSRIYTAFKIYRKFARRIIKKRLSFVKSLPEPQRFILSNYEVNLNKLLVCINRNQILADLINEDVDSLYGESELQRIYDKSSVTNEDYEKVQVTFKLFYRDWSLEGAVERDICYKPILNEIESYFPSTTTKYYNLFNISDEECQLVKILVPGAGLCRLTFEIASRGYFCEGNEFSLFMILASNFILNRCKSVNSCEVYPWIHQVNNVLKTEQQAVKITFPDVCPFDYLSVVNSNNFSMVTGNFLEIYKKFEEWNCIVTCFFIDCTQNVCMCIDLIYELLKPGGVWINFGPLHYHFSDSVDSIELSYEMIREVIIQRGFIFKKEELNIKTPYCQNPNSMLKFTYECIFFVCVKE